uniref:Uncharacterized protein n=1 Tax=Rhizophora mucronata TaxID=61149 RepID=A0A2P2NEV1_RHIMU
MIKQLQAVICYYKLYMFIDKLLSLFLQIPVT